MINQIKCLFGRHEMADIHSLEQYVDFYGCTRCRARWVADHVDGKPKRSLFYQYIDDKHIRKICPEFDNYCYNKPNDIFTILRWLESEWLAITVYSVIVLLSITVFGWLIGSIYSTTFIIGSLIPQVIHALQRRTPK